MLWNTSLATCIAIIVNGILDRLWPCEKYIRCWSLELHWGYYGVYCPGKVGLDAPPKVPNRLQHFCNGIALCKLKKFVFPLKDKIPGLGCCIHDRPSVHQWLMSCYGTMRWPFGTLKGNNGKSFLCEFRVEEGGGLFLLTLQLGDHCFLVVGRYNVWLWVSFSRIVQT